MRTVPSKDEKCPLRTGWTDGQERDEAAVLVTPPLRQVNRVALTERVHLELGQRKAGHLRQYSPKPGRHYLTARDGASSRPTPLYDLNRPTLKLHLERLRFHLEYPRRWQDAVAKLRRERPDDTNTRKKRDPAIVEASPYVAHCL